MTTHPGEDAFRALVQAVDGPAALPAGGAAGVAALAMGVALGCKVIRLSEAGLDETLVQLEALRDELLPHFAEDCTAFEPVLAAMKRPRDDPGRAAALQDAWGVATDAPVAVAVLAARAQKLLTQCEGRIKSSLTCDLSAAQELVGAGRRIAACNARANAGRLPPAQAKVRLAPLGSHRPRG